MHIELHIHNYIIMNILTVADCHGYLNYDILKNHLDLAKNLTDDIFDIIIFLGDNTSNDIRIIIQYMKEKNLNVPCIGILGNHDSNKVLEENNIENIHLKIKIINNIKFGGFEGSIIYKNYGSISYTHQESFELLDYFPECDVFISHSNPQFWKYKKEEIKENLFEYIIRKINNKPKPYTFVQQPLQSDVHSGLIGIGEYINQKKPKYVFHGHIHTNKIYKINDTKIFSCYGVQIIKI